jgi:hypothetical protein
MQVASIYPRMMSVLSPDSSFLRLPSDMPRDQVLFADALRLSAQMAVFSFQNLERLLDSITHGAGPISVNERAVEGICNAYGVIDAVNRFREVLRSFRGLKQNAVFKLFIRATSDVEDLRDVVQHLNQELKAIGNRKASALGTITWLSGSPTEGSPPVAWMLQPGSFYPEQRTFGPVIDLHGRVVPGEITQICLQTSGVRVDLSDVVRRVQEMLAALEPSLRDQSKGKDLLGSDILLHISLQPVAKGDDEPAPGAVR